MPFTFSHPAIILPLSKIHHSKISITGLIVGSLAPDFEYFILMQMRRTHGHELSSFLWFNLPLCIALAFLFHVVLKLPLINSLPHYLHEKLARFKQFNWIAYFKKYWYVFIYSTAIGVFSHIFWDSFTHDHGMFGPSPPFLKITLPVHEMKLFEFLQWISTAFGGLYVILFIMKLPSNLENRQPLLLKMMFWMNVLFVMSIIFIVNPPQNKSDFIATALGSFIYGIVGSSIYYLIYEKIYSTRKEQF